MSKSECERRYKILYLPKDELLLILKVLTQAGNVYEYLQLLELENLPDSKGLKIEAVWFSHERDSFGILLYHPSFEITAEGLIPPEITTYIRIYEVKKGSYLIPFLKRFDKAQLYLNEDLPDDRFDLFVGKKMYEEIKEIERKEDET